MNAEIFEALAQLEKERGIPQAYMLEKITQALVAAYKKDKDGYTDNVFVDLGEGTMRMYVQKEVVDDVFTPATEIALDAARKIDPHAQLGDLVNVDVETKSFGRIAAQTAKQVIIQGIREAERGMIFDSFSSKEHEILTGTVLRVEPQSGDAIIRIGSGSDRTDALLSGSEQVRGERVTEGEIIRVYVVEVRRSSRGPQVIVSRTHPGLVKRLFELNVPEIESGLVEVKSIAREAGSRTKLAVHPTQPGVDAVGACVGTRGGRVSAVVDELRGEKMDIVVWSEDPAAFVASALSPADVISVTPIPGAKACRVIVPDDQLSLAIGKEGQNARLAARLTGYKIDIKPESQAADLEPIPEAAPEELEEPETEAAEITEEIPEAEAGGTEAPAVETEEESEESVEDAE
ncbi:MAG: transcription termination/antitermination protein NusA [Oscillospiraceae bacterium]|nr:transcription termination/antitermination protein NusA [Oscillospiraceae bacterium]